MQLTRQYIWILWDLLAIVILVHSVSRSAKRGFVSTVLGLCVYIAASVAAVMFHEKLAIFLYDNVFHDVIKNALVKGFGDMLTQAGAAQDILHSIPLALRVLIGFKSGEVAALQSGDAGELADQVISVALREPALTILNTACFLIIFTLSAYVMRRLTGFFTGVNRLPVIGVFNEVLGAVAGVLEGLVKLFIAGFIMRMLIAASGEVWWWLNSTVIGSTFIWRLFY